jgi:VWFA-related protein
MRLPLRTVKACATCGLLRGVLLTAIFAAATAMPAQCQAPAGPIAPNPNAKPEVIPAPGGASAPSAKSSGTGTAAPRTRGTIRVRTNEVTAPVTVLDRKGEMVMDLAQKDFHVFDNGVEQPIDHWDLGGEALSVVLVVEASSHIEPLLPAVHQTAIVFTQTVMAQTGRAAVVSYDDTVDLLQPMTEDQDAVETAIRKFKVGTFGLRLYDGMSRGVSILEKEPANRRRVMLVMGEAQDKDSESKLGEVLRAAQLANITIYTIGLSTTAAELRTQNQYRPPPLGPEGTYPLPLPPGTPMTPDAEQEMQGNINLLALAQWIVQRGTNEVKNHALEVAATATGGRFLKTFKDLTMQKAMDNIGGELHAQYTLSYKAPGEEPSGFHDIKVTVSRPDVNVRTRPGYYLAPPPAS